MVELFNKPQIISAGRNFTVWVIREWYLSQGYQIVKHLDEAWVASMWWRKKKYYTTVKSNQYSRSAVFDGVVTGLEKFNKMVIFLFFLFDLFPHRILCRREGELGQLVFLLYCANIDSDNAYISPIRSLLFDLTVSWITSRNLLANFSLLVGKIMIMNPRCLSNADMTPSANVCVPAALMRKGIASFSGKAFRGNLAMIRGKTWHRFTCPARAKREGNPFSLTSRRYPKWCPV